MLNHLQYKENANSSRSASELIKYVSHEIYNRIGFVHTYSNKKTFMRIYEVTLTQNLVYELHKFEKETGLTLFKMFESESEETNGSDLLLCLPVTAGNYIQVPVQAKLLKTFKAPDNGSYASFHHKNTNGLQINLLKKYAEELGSYLPLYLFYNYTKGSINIDAGESEELYGCSYMNVNDSRIPVAILNKSTIRFSDLHASYAFPFYRLFGYSNGGGNGQNSDVDPDDPDYTPKPYGPFEVLKELYARFGMKIDEEKASRIKLVPESEILEDRDWNAAFSGDVGKKDSKSSDSFRPKYKVVLLANPDVTGGKLNGGQYLPVDGESDGEDVIIEGDLVSWEYSQEEGEAYVVTG